MNNFLTGMPQRFEVAKNRVLLHGAVIEIDNEYFKLAERSIPRLAGLYPDFIGEELQMNGDYGSVEREDKKQLAMVLAEKKVTYRTKLSAKTRRN
jgi:hypothetical protein